MPIIDIVIVVAILISVIIGFVRGLIKEAVSIASLVIAIWAALYFGPAVGTVAESWISNAEMQAWFGRVLVFAIVLSLGGLLGWGLSKLVRLSVLSGLDRFLGTLFGALRGIIIVALLVLAGGYAGFANDPWWLDSNLIPHFEVIADWIEAMAPKGLEMITPEEPAESIPIELSF